MELQMAPAWQTTAWLNTPKPLDLAQLRGKVVVLHAFQMLCPGCVANAIPQAKRVAALFADVPVAVIGLHTVFEHHAAMGRKRCRRSSMSTACTFRWALTRPARKMIPFHAPCAPTPCRARRPRC